MECTEIFALIEIDYFYKKYTMSFKLIAIHPLKGCDKEILKNLSTDQIYFFDNSYTVNEFGALEKTSDYIPVNFFFSPTEQSSLQSINIQALVGKNGEGKSSLVELLIRILNNFFKQYQIGEVTKQLIFAKGVYANLYYETDNNIYQLQVDSRIVQREGEEFRIIAKAWENQNIIYDSTTLDKDSMFKRKEEFINLRNLFFTMYINYSIYGLNELDYVNENEYIPLTGGYPVETMDKFLQLKNDSWLTHIFHKNDGYQTPIVLHPFRIEGQIDVNNEKYLVSQRLLSLIIEENNNHYHITEDLIANKIHLRFRNVDSLNEYIKGFIHNIIKTNDFSKVETILQNAKKELSKERTLGLIDQYYNFLKDNFFLLNKFKTIINFSYHSSITDLFMINIETFDRISEKDLPDYHYINSEEDLRNYISKIKSYFSEDVFKKIEFILLVTNKINFNLYNLFQLFSIYYKHWIQYFEIDEKELATHKPDITFEYNLFYYILTKSFKTIRYPKYSSLNRTDTIEYFSANLHLSQRTNDFHKEFLGKISNQDESHISIKIRQSITILELAIKHPKNDLILFYKGIIVNPSNINFNTLNKHIHSSKEDKDQILFLPPRIFETEIFLKSISSGTEDINIKRISSGEYQKNAIISSLIYHLKNLDSIEYTPEQSSETLKAIKIVATYAFSNIYIILDEIELYFHPEYQRLFISELLFKISKTNFKNIKNINLLFVTHSPFILSDIPKSNVLFLEKGKPANAMNENTFAANIHTLLQHGFFLNSVPIGNFAKDKINYFFNLLHKGITTDNFGNDLYNQIILVSEPFIKSQLLKLYNDLNSNTSTFEHIIRNLQEEVRKLKVGNNDKN